MGEILTMRVGRVTALQPRVIDAALERYIELGESDMTRIKSLAMDEDALKRNGGGGGDVLGDTTAAYLTVGSKVARCPQVLVDPTNPHEWMPAVEVVARADIASSALHEQAAQHRSAGRRLSGGLKRLPPGSAASYEMAMAKSLDDAGSWCEERARTVRRTEEWEVGRVYLGASLYRACLEDWAMLAWIATAVAQCSPLAERLRQARAIHGLTLREMSTEIRVGYSTLRRWLRPGAQPIPGRHELAIDELLYGQRRIA